MEDIVSINISRQRLNMLLMTIFGGSALVLAAIGIYGLMAYSVQHRTQRSVSAWRSARRPTACAGASSARA